MKLKDICKQHTIVGEDGVNYCDTENCPFAKRDLGIDFMPTDHYSCIADYPYLKENHEADLLKEFVEWLKKRLDEQCTHLKNGDEFDLERSIGIHIVLSNLDKHLEKFLEAKK